MTKRWTHSASFAFFGAVPRNPRWSWSGRSPDGKIVAVTFWQDLFEDKGRLYRSVDHPQDAKWLGSLGHKELLDNLKWHWSHCKGELRIIVATPKDAKASPRSIATCFPHPALRKRLTYFDEFKGEFVAERIEGAA